VPEGGNVIPALLNEYTPAWFAALVIAGAMAAMMSSSDSMLLSGSSYLTRDLYRPLLNPDASETKEGWVARLGVVAFAVLSFVASLFVAGGAGGGGFDLLVSIGDTAFGGYAQLALPVMVALYWARTTRLGMIAGILGSQAFYLAHVFGSLPATYLGWDYALYGMALSLVLTVGVSLVTTAAPEEKAARFTDSDALQAD
jgi:SSS family solute:Na+ symporter